MRVSDLVSGLILAVLAIVFFSLTLSFPPFPGQKYGPSLFPRILASLTLLCSVLLIIRAMRNRKSGEPLVSVADWASDPRQITSFALILGAILLYIFTSEKIGFIPIAFAILLTLFLWFRARPVVALPVAIIATWTIHYFFGTLMRVPLPRGILNNIL